VKNIILQPCCRRLATKEVHAQAFTNHRSSGQIPNGSHCIQGRSSEVIDARDIQDVQHGRTVHEEPNGSFVIPGVIVGPVRGLNCDLGIRAETEQNGSRP
jgi:hypothetical protein